MKRKHQHKSETEDDLERSERLTYTASRYRELQDYYMGQRRMSRKELTVIEAAQGWRDSDQAAAECAILLQALAALDKP